MTKLFTILLILGSAVYNTEAFWPKASFTYGAPGSISHEELTKTTILGTGYQGTVVDSGLIFELFGVSTLSKSMRRAANQISEANADTDKDQSPHLHFDAETFTAAQSHLRTMAFQCVHALKRNDAELARLWLGRALHTLQDFYSHTDWIELGNTSPCDSLVYPFPLFSNLAGITEPTCDGLDPDPDTKKLTSGYYGASGPPPVPNKCIHGGPFDSLGGLVLGLGINKDSVSVRFSPHGHSHVEAIRLAGLSTRAYVLGIREILTADLGNEDADRKLRLLLGADFLTLTSLNNSSTFSLEVTLNGKVIRSVTLLPRRSTNIFIDDLTGAANHTLRILGTDNIGSLTGLSSYMVSLPSSLEFIRVVSDRGSTTSLSGRDHTDSLVLRPPEGALAHRYNDYTLRTIRPPGLFAGGGAPPPPGSNTVELLAVTDSVNTTSKTYVVAVDSTMSGVTFSFSGNALLGESNATALFRPDGSKVLSGEPGAIVTASPFAIEYVISTPVAGQWQVKVSGTNFYTLNVYGKGTLDLLTFEFVRLEGRVGHEGYYALPGNPVAGQTNTAHAEFVGAVQSAQFELRSLSGQPILNFGLVRGLANATNEFLGGVLLPTDPFLTYALGLDASGNAFQRLVPDIRRTQPIQVHPPLAKPLYPGKLTHYDFRVINHGDNDIFRTVAVDTRSYLVRFFPTNFILAAGQTTNVVVELLTPTNTPTGISDAVTLTAQSTSANGVRNSASILTAVFELPRLSIVHTLTGVILEWAGGAGTLQYANDPSGPWIDLLGAETPYAVEASEMKMFYRVKL